MKFDKKLPLIKNAYVVIHSVVLLVAFQELAVKKLVCILMSCKFLIHFW